MSNDFPHIPINIANENLKRYVKMYEYIHQNDNRMKLSEFKKYEVLYQKHSEEEFYDSNVEKDYHHLSMEFLQRINPYKPFVVINDDTGEEYTFPAIYQRLSTMKPEHSELSQNFNRYGLVTDRPDYTRRAMNQFVDAYLSNQDFSETTISNNRLTTYVIADKLMNRVNSEGTVNSIENADTVIDIETVEEPESPIKDVDNSVSVSWSFDE